MKINFLTKPVLDVTKKEYVRFLNNAKNRVPIIGSDLKAAGLTGNVDEHFVDKLCYEAFTANSRDRVLSRKTKGLLRGALREMGLPENTSVREFIKRAKSFVPKFDISLDIPCMK